MSRIVAGVGFTNQQDRFGAFEIAVPRPWRVRVRPGSELRGNAGASGSVGWRMRRAEELCRTSSANRGGWVTEETPPDG